MNRCCSPFFTSVMLVTLSASGHASTLLSENFDELTAGLGVTSVGAFSAIGGTNVDIVGPSSGLCASPESGNCVDLSGTGGDPQGILESNTAFFLSRGTNYYLSFDLVGSGRGTEDSATVTFAGYDQTFTLTSGDVTSGIISNALVTVSSAGSYYLTFTDNSPGDIGLLLDKVSITTGPSIATPEPASLLLTIPLLLAAFACKRRSISELPSR